MLGKTGSFAFMSCLVFGLAACNMSPVPAFNPETNLPAVSQGYSRVLFFRAGGGGITSGGSFRPIVFVDGQEIAECVPETGFYVDVPAGMHRLEGRTNYDSAYKRTRELNIRLDAGKTTYITCDTYIDTAVRIFEFKVADPAYGAYVRFLNTLVPDGPYRINR